MLLSEELLLVSETLGLWSYNSTPPVVAKDGQRIDIPDGSTIENRWSMLRSSPISAELYDRPCVW